MEDTRKSAQGTGCTRERSQEEECTRERVHMRKCVYETLHASENVHKKYKGGRECTWGRECLLKNIKLMATGESVTTSPRSRDGYHKALTRLRYPVTHRLSYYLARELRNETRERKRFWK